MKYTRVSILAPTQNTHRALREKYQAIPRLNREQTIMKFKRFPRTEGKNVKIWQIFQVAISFQPSHPQTKTRALIVLLYLYRARVNKYDGLLK